MKSKLTYRNTFYFISTAGIVFFLLTAFFIDDNIRLFDYTALGGLDTMSFSDFLRHVYFGSDLMTTYDKGWDACFPPLAYLFFHFLWKINPIFSENPGIYGNYFEEPYELLIMIMCFSLFTLLAYYAIEKILNRTSGEGLLLTSILLMSMPFTFATFQRGNPIYLVFVMLLLALKFRDSDRALLRELALILIAIAAAFKIYPAIFGLLYVKEKRWKEAIRLFIYGVVLFFVPFIWVGGWHDFLLFLIYLTDRGTLASYSWTSVRGIIMYFLKPLGLSEHLIKMIGFACENVFFIGSVSLIFISKRRWKTLLFMTSLMALYVVTNFIYTLDYVAIAAVFFAAESDSEILSCRKQKILNILYAILFGMIFTLPVWGYPLNIPAEHCVYGALYIMLIIAATEEIIIMIKRKGLKKIADKIQ